MSEITQGTPTRNQLFSAYDYSKIFLFDNKYRKVTIPNATEADVDLAVGTLIGIVTSTYQVYKSGTSNISLVGVLAESVTIPANDSLDVDVCIGGKVAAEKLVFDGTDTLDTVVAYKPIRDRLESDTMGIYVVETNELTAADNT